MRKFALLSAAALAALACGTAQAQAQDADRDRQEQRALDRLASPELTTFRNDREFDRYLRDLRRAVRRLDDRRAERDRDDVVVVAMMQEVDPDEVCTDEEVCPEEEAAGQSIVVTGSRVSAPAAAAAPITIVDASGNETTSITNNQVLGVDEGDIVKLIGDYLLVLQDGRIFSANYKTMQLVDRIDVYRNEDVAADWYDEMLVQDDQIIVTAYNYREDASEVSVFQLDRATGRIARRGVFLITSEDYYDIDNYATRVVDDKLVIYTPYEAKQVVSRRSRPVIRRWVEGEDFEDADDEGQRILDADNIYKPVFGVRDPWVHTVSICPLDRLEERGLRCESTAFMGGYQAEMYVGRDAAYLYVGQSNRRRYWDMDQCSEDATANPPLDAIEMGAIFRIDIDGGDPRVVGVRGKPVDQFSFGESDRRFRMLSRQDRTDCYQRGTQAGNVHLLDIGKGLFGDTFYKPRRSHYVDIPDTPRSMIANRFVGDWLVYGSRDNWGGRPPYYSGRRLREEPEVEPGKLFAIPLEEPEDALEIGLDHQLTRMEVLGNGLIVTGYAGRDGLYVDRLDLSGVPRIASTQFLKERFESESRSHAFNATFDREGRAILGLPTVVRKEDSGRYWWWSDTSDISFLTMGPDQQLASVGALLGQSEDDVETAEGYRCEVSCIDWYGNARPIFIGERILGLMGTGLVTAEIRDGAIRETGRLDLTIAPAKSD